MPPKKESIGKPSKNVTPPKTRSSDALPVALPKAPEQSLNPQQPLEPQAVAALMFQQQPQDPRNIIMIALGLIVGHTELAHVLPPFLDCVTNLRHPCDGAHLKNFGVRHCCAKVECAKGVVCRSDCLTCPVYMRHGRCTGMHPVNGPEGCHFPQCSGRSFCVRECTGCPCNLPYIKCTGKHPIMGEGGCNNEKCRFRERCVWDCRECPCEKRHAYCAGFHPVHGVNGCFDGRCSGRGVCHRDCKGCPSIPGLPACDGKHGRCANGFCAPGERCGKSCTLCPCLAAAVAVAKR